MFARAAQQRKVEDHLMMLAIIHNPYQKDEQGARRLFSDLRFERERLSRGGDPRKPGIRLADIAQALGPIKREFVTREEFEAKGKPRSNGR